MSNILDNAIQEIRSDGNFMQQFLKNQGSAAANYGLNRLREEFRRLHYKNLAFHNNEVYGGLYQRADSIAEVNKNEKFIADAIGKRLVQLSRADADDGLIFQRQLEKIDARRFQVKYRPLGTWREYLPVQNVEPGLERITYRIEDGTDQVEPATVGRSGNTPYVGASTKEFYNKVVAKTLGYRYSVLELHRAAFAGVPLQDRYQRQVLRGYEKNLQQTMYNGDAAEDLEGLFNHTGVSNNQASTPGTGSDKTWAGADKTNDEKVADIRGMVTTVAVQTEENYNADNTEFVLLLPRVPYDALNVRYATTADVTVLEFILQQKKYGISDIRVVPELAGIGTGTTNLAFLMPKMDAEIVEAMVGEAILWQPMERKGLDIRFPSIQYHGGVVIRYPIAMTQLYGV
jgi:hypothetical protein